MKMPNPHTVWSELIRLLPEVHVAPHLGGLMLGTAYVPEPVVEDGKGPRPALIDKDGRRWLLDGSGEVA